MTFQKVSAGRGIEWIKSGVALIMANPVTFGLITLIYFGISLGLAFIPILGAIASNVLVPVFIGGFLYALKQQDEGGSAQVEHIFRGFQEQGKVVPLLMLSIPGIIFMVVLIVLMVVIGFGAVAGAGISASANSGALGAGALAGMGIGFLLIFLVGLVGGLAIYSLLFFAIPRVMFDGLDAFAAIKESIAVALANVAPFLLVAVILFGFILVAAIFMIIPFLGWLVFIAAMFVLTPISTAAMYFAYKDIFSAAAVVPAPPPSQYG